MEENQLNEYVRLSLEADVSPIDMRFIPILDIQEGLPLAYRTRISVSSIMEGYLNEDDYTPVSDVDPIGISFFSHAVRHATLAYEQFVTVGRDPKFITVRCATSVWNDTSIYDTLKQALKFNPAFPHERLVIEFSPDILKEDRKAVATVMKDIKSLRVKTAVSHVGDDGFPLTELNELTPDIVFLDAKATAYAGSKSKPRYLSSLISFLNAMDIEVYAEGEEKMRKLLRTSDARGLTQTDLTPLTLEEALKGGIA